MLAAFVANRPVFAPFLQLRSGRFTLLRLRLRLLLLVQVVRTAWVRTTQAALQMSSACSALQVRPGLACVGRRRGLVVRGRSVPLPSSSSLYLDLVLRKVVPHVRF